MLREDLLTELRESSFLQLEIGVALAFPDDLSSPFLTIETGLSTEHLRRNRLKLHVPTMDPQSEGWWAEARWASETSLTVENFAEEATTGRIQRLSRTSPRIDPGPECEVRVTTSATKTAIAASCIDLSAGGIGLKTEEQVAIEPGEDVELHIRLGSFQQKIAGTVAYTTRMGRGETRFGVAFAPIPAPLAFRYYRFLNGIAGEPIVESLGRHVTLAKFREAMGTGCSGTIEAEIEGEVVDTDGKQATLSLRDPTSIDGLAECVSRLRIHTEDAVWSLEIARSDDLTFEIQSIRQLLPGGEPEAKRHAGYRVDAPPSCSVVLRRSDGEHLKGAELRDISRGGIGVRLGEHSARAGEQLEVDLTLGKHFHKTVPGRIAFVKESAETGATAGVAFHGLSDDQMVEIHHALSRLENQQLMTVTVMIGLGVFAFLAILVGLGLLVTPKLDEMRTQIPAAKSAAQSADDAEDSSVQKPAERPAE